MLTVRSTRLRSRRDYTATTPCCGSSRRFATAQRSRSLSERSGHARSRGFDARGRGLSQRRRTALAAGRSPNEHEESGLLADDSDVSLAGRGVLQSKHAAGRQSPGLTVGRGDGKGDLQKDAELNCGGGMVEGFFGVLRASAWVT